MRDREWTIVGLLVLLMLTIWLGFLLHRSPRFAGSLSGGLLGVIGSILMLVPLGAYSVVKRVRSIKRRVTGWMSMRTLLSVHIYAALIGSILVLLHTGHKFDSLLGMAQTVMVFLVVLSGFIGRHLTGHISQGIHEKKQMLQGLQHNFEQMRQAIVHKHVEQVSVQSARDKTLNSPHGWSQTDDSVSSVSAVASAIADLENSIAVHNWMKNWFRKWWRFHVAITGVLCFLLALHVWSGVYYGLRWFR